MGSSRPDWRVHVAGVPNGRYVLHDTETEEPELDLPILDESYVHDELLRPDKWSDTSVPRYIRKALSPRIPLSRFSKRFDLSTDFYLDAADDLLRHKWDTHNSNWKGDTGVFRFQSDNVRIAHDPFGRRALTLSVSGPTDGEFGTAFVRSRGTLSLGFVEVLCKLGDSAVSSSFWLKEVARPSGRGRLEREVDVFEYAAAPVADERQRRWAPEGFFGLFLSNLRHRTPWRAQQGRPAPFGPDVSEPFMFAEGGENLCREKYLRVGLLVMPDRISWFVNGQCVRRSSNWIFKEFVPFGWAHGFDKPEMHIQFDREVMAMHVPRAPDGRSVRDGVPVRIGNEPDRDFRIYYCRTWQYRGW